jgi:imidazole glycerol-phosphate synthase subunit HisH
VNEVIVVDYGAGNTRSVCAALTHLDRNSLVTSDPARIRDAEFVVLPGVGSARSAMVHLDETGAAGALRHRFAQRSKILGICLGMQLAMAHSDEDGGVDGLALLEGDVVRLEEDRVPRLGWSVVEPWGDAYYFAHSFAVRSPDAIATVDGVTVAVRRDEFFGVQFHPEKSGPAGLTFLDQCLSRA